MGTFSGFEWQEGSVHLLDLLRQLLHRPPDLCHRLNGSAVPNPTGSSKLSSHTDSHRLCAVKERDDSSFW